MVQLVNLGTSVTF